MASSKKPRRPAAPTKKKASGKKPRKRNVETREDTHGREVPAGVPETGAGLAKRYTHLRKIAATDYITDPDGHSVRWHHEREDREYRGSVHFDTFQAWSAADKWVDRREAYWEHIEQRIREHIADDYLRRRLNELDLMEEHFATMSKFLQPLTDKNGELILGEDKMPQFALKLPSMDKFVAMWLKVHERILLLRGEVTARTERRTDEGDGDVPPLNAHLRDRTGQIQPKISSRDVKLMARRLVLSRQPGLAQELGEEIDDGVDEHAQVQAESAAGSTGGADSQ